MLFCVINGLRARTQHHFRRTMNCIPVLTHCGKGCWISSEYNMNTYPEILCIYYAHCNARRMSFKVFVLAKLEVMTSHKITDTSTSKRVLFSYHSTLFSSYSIEFGFSSDSICLESVFDEDGFKQRCCYNFDWFSDSLASLLVGSPNGGYVTNTVSQTCHYI